MTRIRLSRQAESDIHGVWDYLGIEKSSPDSACKQVEAIFDKLELIASQPLLGELRNNLRSGLRGPLAGQYVTLYFPLNDGIEVVAVVHAARDIQA